MERIYKLNSVELRCPFCNINDVTEIDEDSEQQWKEGYRFYCSICENFYFEPILNFSDVLMIVEDLEYFMRNEEDDIKFMEYKNKLLEKTNT